MSAVGYRGGVAPPCLQQERGVQVLDGGGSGSGVGHLGGVLVLGWDAGVRCGGRVGGVGRWVVKYRCTIFQQLRADFLLRVQPTA